MTKKKQEREPQSLVGLPRWSVIDYVREEVERQQHDVTKPDGIRRVGWMLEAWAWACETFNDDIKPTMDDAIIIGRMIEPQKNDCGIRQCGVAIRNSDGCVVKSFPACGEVPDLLKRLFLHRDAATPIELYKAFEEIHPFVDGNGRCGKIIMNAMAGTLLRPFFPPANLFGYPIRNP